LTLTFPGTIAGLDAAASRLRGFLDEAALSGAGRYHVELAFDELAGNIIRHGQPSADIELTVSLDGTHAVLAFEDDGHAFDPRAHAPRALDTDLEHAHAGGLGLRLVQTFAKRLDYQRTRDCRNRLTIAIPIV
jgi:anti-sigma regulatory factor (Ser/Thr protein kinase)